MQRFFGDRYYWGAGNPFHDIAELVRDLDHSTVGIVIDRAVSLNRFSPDALGDIAFLDQIHGGESAKTLSAVTRFIATHQRELDRNSVVVVLGGGAVLDLVGLCCGLMYRGIRYVSVPTSLMAMADAAYGGKTAVNYASKNQIGMYHHPECVYVNAAFLQTLPDLHLRSGMIEIAKLAVFFDDIRTALHGGTGLVPTVDLALLAARRKLELLDRDPFEDDVASVLLYGHAFGNAFEVFATERRGWHMPHGLAVALGMSFSAWLWEQLCEPRQRHVEQLELVAEWLNPVPYAANVTPSDGATLRELLVRDKYARGDQVRIPAICDRNGFETVELSVVTTAYEEWRAWLLAQNEEKSEAKSSNMMACASSAAFIAGRPVDETVAPLQFGSADGPFIITTDGRRLLDWSSCLNAPLGHSVRVDTAILPVNAGNYRTEQRDALVERLAELFPNLAGFQFRSSGAEAVEAALRYLTTLFGARLHLVTVEGCYHGLTLGAQHLMGAADVGLARTELDFPMLSTERVSRKLEALLREGPVAVWVEGVQGATLRRLPSEFIEVVRRLRVDAPHRLVLVCDDMLASIRCGYWCSVPLDPDVLISGKSWAAGYPFSFFGVAGWIREAAGDILGTTSYGGNPVACAHALHTIERVGPLLERIQSIEASHASRFAENVATYPAAVLRSEWHGLLFGYELRNDAMALATARTAADHGLLVSQLGPVIRCSPPIDITDEYLDVGLSRLLTVTESMTAV